MLGCGPAILCAATFLPRSTWSSAALRFTLTASGSGHSAIPLYGWEEPPSQQRPACRFSALQDELHGVCHAEPLRAGSSFPCCAHWGSVPYALYFRGLELSTSVITSLIDDAQFLFVALLGCFLPSREVERRLLGRASCAACRPDYRDCRSLGRPGRPILTESRMSPWDGSIGPAPRIIATICRRRLSAPESRSEIYCDDAALRPRVVSGCLGFLDKF